MCPAVKKVDTAEALSNCRAVSMSVNGCLEHQGLNDKRLSLFLYTKPLLLQETMN